MLKKEDILNIIKKYDLNSDKVKILSGASLVLQGLKEETKDIDITVSKNKYIEFLKKYECVLEKTGDHKKGVYYIDNIINFGIDYVNVDTITYNDLNLQTINSCLELKEKLCRDKDSLDIKKINDYKKEKLDFIFNGRGAMLYPQEGNTSCTFNDSINTFIIDCGESVTSRLILDNTLNKDQEFYFLNTHTHSDHIGSIGTLIQYLYYMRGKKLNIIYDDNMKNFDNLYKAIDCMGVEPDQYRFIHTKQLDNRFSKFDKIRYINSNHGNTPLFNSSIIIYSKNGDILYTGDIANSDVINEFINNSKNIDKIFTDTSYTKTPVHLYIDELDKLQNNVKKKIWCMHINNKDIIPVIEKKGYNLVKNNCKIR